LGVFLPKIEIKQQKGCGRGNEKEGMKTKERS
jgi:hypothetical protein